MRRRRGHLKLGTCADSCHTLDEKFCMSDENDIRWTRLDRMACGKCGVEIDVSQQPPFSTVECPECGTKQTVPVQLGQFLLVEQLGVGGMGAVYRAMDSTLGRFVAIKVMKAEMGEDPALVESFLREARAAAALNHPNIVQIYSCGQEQGQPYIVMELVSGGRLDLMMADGKKVPEVGLLEISLDVADGLKAANEAGLVHGDIKPANILLDKNGRARITDFGLAMFVNRQQEQGGVWGTPYYISPERARGGKADHRSDIYSLGATMFHALAGKPPFDGHTAADVVVARLKGPPPKLIDVEPGVQQRTSDLVDRMIAADPVHRYPTSASLLADMRDTLENARKAYSTEGIGQRKKKKRNQRIILTIAVLALLGIGFALWQNQKTAPKKAVRGKAKTTARTSPAATKTKTQQAKKTTPPKEAAQTNVIAPEIPPEPELPTITVNEGRRAKTSMLFFSASEERDLVKTLGDLDTKPDRTLNQLSSLAKNAPDDSPQQLWLRALQALPYWATGDSTSAEEALRRVADTTVKQRTGHPAFMPQALALYLLGDLPEDQFERERGNWPSWYGELAGLFQGTRALFSNDSERAAPRLAAYTKSKRNEPAWAYSLQPPASRWLGAIEKLASARRDAMALVNDGDADAAVAAVTVYANSAPPYLAAAAQQLKQEVEAERDRIETEKREAEIRARQPQIDADYERINEWLVEQIPQLAQQKEFRKVAFAARRFEKELQTPEGKERARIVVEQLERMEALKAALVNELGDAPFRRPDRELGGDAIGATVLGARVSIPNQGISTRTWEQMSPRLFALLLAHIAENGPTAKIRADRLLSVAILSAYYGGYEGATNFAAQAREADPQLGPTIDRLLPDGPIISKKESK